MFVLVLSSGIVWHANSRNETKPYNVNKIGKDPFTTISAYEQKVAKTDLMDDQTSPIKEIQFIEFLGRLKFGNCPLVKGMV